MQMWSSFHIRTSIEPVRCDVARGEDEGRPYRLIAAWAEQPGTDRDPSTFRVTASTGSWRSLPWPFGLVDVSDTDLRIRSFGWSWWVPDRCVEREQVTSVTVRKILGAATFSIVVDNAPSITPQTSTSVNQLTDSLRHHGYPIA